MTSYQFSNIASALANAPEECVLATLVSVTGSSFRRPGARMLILPNREIVGAITAGCLQEDIRQCAFEWTRNGSCVKEFQLGTPEDDLIGWGSGCKGTLRILLNRVSPADCWFVRVTQALKFRKSSVSATVFDADAALNLTIGQRFLTPIEDSLTDSESEWIQTALLSEAASRHGTECEIVHYSTPSGKFSVLWECICPPIQLSIFGTDESVAALLTQARSLGWTTLLCSKRTELYNRQQGLIADKYFETFIDLVPQEISGDDRTVAIVMTHHFADDLDIVKTLLNTTGVPFVGILGGNTRNQHMREELSTLVPQENFSKLRAPLGLDIGAEEPFEIATSIAAEVMAFMNLRSAAPLSMRMESIHAATKQDHRVLITEAVRECAECVS